VKLLEESHLIESKYQIISNGSLHHRQQLTPKNSSEGGLIDEKLSIEFFLMFEITTGLEDVEN
jgi:hypothetical protein